METLENLSKEKLKNFSNERSKEDIKETKNNISKLLKIYETSINIAIENSNIESLNTYIDTYLKLIELEHHYKLFEEINSIQRELFNLRETIKWLK